ncbi:DALR anticodon-binding domain-containing protein [Pseudanabaena sp. PCC 6802]|uniref:DALR anticodon-binding domain-containing protein n=1 Tax=Pseudanabaena sp. PCC 6802 TaxID=118173 RepID=UPI000345D66F|nr:DALR anticodon-binding domain-containing protein [Pseudanabaena sp. PCC 6802]
MISLTRLLQIQLAEAIQIALGIDRIYAEIPVKPYVTKQSESYQSNTYHYTSPIALSLAHQVGRSSLEIARDIDRGMEKLSCDRFSTAVEGEGWLNFRLSDRLIAESLYALSQTLKENEIATPDQPQNFPGYTYVQYAYARCCALLRLARQLELMGDWHDFSWQLLDPTGNLYLRESVEMRLALCLVDFEKRSKLDELERKRAIKLSKNLAANFLDFYDTCRIASAARDLSEARMGLVATTQKVIAYLASGLIFLPEFL